MQGARAKQPIQRKREPAKALDIIKFVVTKNRMVSESKKNSITF
jgi:hypothetical protein